MTDNNPHVVIEVCADSVASAVAAQRGGADRVELCGSLLEGGITPSTGLIEMTRSSVSLELAVMIRPRGGDFCYDRPEFETMRRDIAIVKRMGASAIVFGILDVNGNVDMARTRQLVEEARPLAVTFHRAFDMSADLFRALEDICAAGVDRVLTSGGQPNSLQGQDTLQQLVKRAKSRITVMAGSGIKPENARRLVDHTGVKEIHVGLRTCVPSPMQYRNPRVAMGAVEGHEYQRCLVLEEDVSRLRDALQTKS